MIFAWLTFIKHELNYLPSKLIIQIFFCENATDQQWTWNEWTLLLFKFQNVCSNDCLKCLIKEDTYAGYIGTMTFMVSGSHKNTEVFFNYFCQVCELFPFHWKWVNILRKRSVDKVLDWSNTEQISSLISCNFFFKICGIRFRPTFNSNLKKRFIWVRAGM